MWDFRILMSPSKNPFAYRISQGITYDKTANSQEESNSNWHSLMSNAEADAGMSEKDTMNRGLQFGWIIYLIPMVEKTWVNSGKAYMR